MRHRSNTQAPLPQNYAITHHPAGEAPDHFSPGDFSLHRATTDKKRHGKTTILGKLIQAGERIRFGNSDCARWTHAALIVSEDGALCEALTSGVQEDNIEKYRNSDYVIVHANASDEEREHACEFALMHVGDKYGVLNFLSLGFQALLGWHFSLHMDNQFICSGLVARATEKYIVAYPMSPEDMMPADLASFWRVRSHEPRPALGTLGHLLNLLIIATGFLRSH